MDGQLRSSNLSGQNAGGTIGFDRNLKQEFKLLELAIELRRKIYAALFRSTRLAFGERHITNLSKKTIKQKPHALALRRVCHQIQDEIGDSWLGYILWSFESFETLLDILSPIPAATLAKIRHIRVHGGPLILRPIGSDVHCLHALDWMLKLLPGLQLERLTVLVLKDGQFAYDTLNALIEHGDGWRELRYITPNSSMLSFAGKLLVMDDQEHYKRQEPQPSNWLKMIQQRDGTNSNPTLVVYRANVADSPGSVLN